MRRHEDPDELICLNRKCRFQGDRDDFGYTEEGERYCPMCDGTEFESVAERDERLKDDYWQQKLDERRGK